jgi:hypothetical protein
MSRIIELKKQYPELSLTMFDLFERIDTTKTYKYFPLMCKLFSSRWKLEPIEKDFSSEMKNRLESKGIKITDEKDSLVHAMLRLADNYSDDMFLTTKEFIERMENNKIQNKDLSTYNSLENLRTAITLSSIKEIERGLEKQVIKEFEDDIWLVVRPLTFQASSKYGANTRWCTTYSKEKEYFAKYWRRGILVYFINKQTGFKFAGYKSLFGDPELSFWDPTDQRVDYLQLDIDDYLFSITKKIFSSTDSNRDLCDLETSIQVEKECTREFEDAVNYLFPEDSDIMVDRSDPPPHNLQIA